jgi:hypothetical protein
MSKKNVAPLTWWQRIFKWFLPTEPVEVIPEYQEIVDPARAVIEALKAYEEYHRNEAVSFNSKVLDNLNKREASKREADRAMKAMKAVGSIFGKT